MVHYCLVWSLKLMWLKPFKHQSPFRTSQIWTWTDVDKLLDRRTFSPRCTPPPSHPAPPPPEGSDHPPGRPSALGWTHSVFPRGTWPTACCWRPGSRGSGWRGHWGVCPEVTPQFHSQTLLQQTVGRTFDYPAATCASADSSSPSPLQASLLLSSITFFITFSSLGCGVALRWRPCRFNFNV